jgi:hypothetical protein
MKSAGRHGSSALLLVMKVMVWHFVSNSHKVMTAHIVILPSNCCCWDFSTISKIWVFLCFFFCEVTHQNLHVQICIGNYCQMISCTTWPCNVSLLLWESLVSVHIWIAMTWVLLMPMAGLEAGQMLRLFNSRPQVYCSDMQVKYIFS